MLALVADARAAAPRAEPRPRRGAPRRDVPRLASAGSASGRTTGLGGGGRAQRARSEAPGLCAARQHRGRADDVAAGGDRRRQELRLPLLVGARRGVHARRAHAARPARAGARVVCCLLRAVRQTAPTSGRSTTSKGASPSAARARPPPRLPRLAPVRYGNAATHPAAARLLGRPARDRRPLRLARATCSTIRRARCWPPASTGVAVIWPDEDSGMWELDEHHHYTTSKIAVWMAFDRAIRLRRGRSAARRAPRPVARGARTSCADGSRRTAGRRSSARTVGWAGEETLDAGVLRACRMGWTPSRSA